MSDPGAPPPGSVPSPPARSGLVVLGVIGLAAVVLTGLLVVDASGDDGATTIESILAEAGDDGPPSGDDGPGSSSSPPSEGTGEPGESAGPASGSEPSAPPTAEANPSCAGAADGTLTFGALLPHTGDLAFLGPPSDAAARLAVEDVNAAGGVLGRDVEYRPGDSGDEAPDVASATVEGHLGAGADVILGSLASGISLRVIDRVTGACRIQISSANTSDAFTTYPDGDLYFRTAPSDALQGQAVADLMIEDGAATAAILARRDAYGEALLGYIRGPFEQQGGSVSARVYEPDAAGFQAEVDMVTGTAPDAVVVVGFAETSIILDSLFDAGISADTTRIYLVDGNIGNYLGESITHPGALDGVRGTLPAAEVTGGFRDRMLSVDPALVDFTYGPETYDAVVVTALAAAAAGTDNPADVARRINGITRDGEPCDAYEACLALLDQGEDIDYDGESGPLELDRSGEPSIAPFAVQSYGPDNRIDDSATVHRLAAR